ncbi:MAG: amino acid ABC transporter permease [Clostridia bacterium]|nr:amino acid ABC transporter permease [Clostridia bacterium]MBQ1982580.1 amino acid ABC transporter permease [Clostridia bacterium]MBQ5724807.1 amino acid ABC transporter permease [Clostridia bacterium]
MNTWQVLYDLLSGFGLTLKLFGLTLLISIPLGLLFSVLSMTRFKPVSYLMKFIIWVVRGTPLLLQCVVVTFIPSVLFKIPNKDFANMLGIDTMADLQFAFVLIAFALNYACYFAVIFEGGFKSIPRGQYEAGQVLGMTRTQIFFRVVLMQMVRRIVSPMSNEVITLVKDTALARALSVVEIIAIAYEKVNKYAVLTPLLYAGLFYLAFSGLLTLLFHFLEKKLSYYSV